jgi:hypothetical protein
MNEEGYQESSILMILKKELHFKNSREIMNKYEVLEGFLREKVCWKSEEEYKQILWILSSLLTRVKEIPSWRRNKNMCQLRGDTLNWGYNWGDGGIEKTLSYFQIDTIIRRWVLEKF